MIPLFFLAFVVLVLFFKSLWSYSAIEQTQMSDHLDQIQQRSLVNGLSLSPGSPLPEATTTTPKPSPVGRPNLRLVTSSERPPDHNQSIPNPASVDPPIADPTIADLTII